MFANLDRNEKLQPAAYIAAQGRLYQVIEHVRDGHGTLLKVVIEDCSTLHRTEFLPMVIIGGFRLIRKAPELPNTVDECLVGPDWPSKADLEAWDAVRNA